MAAISAIVGAIGISNTGQINDMADRMYDRELLGLSYVKEANINLIYIGRARGNFLLATTAEERDNHLAAIEKYSAAVTDYMGKARPLFITEQGKQKLASFATGWEEYQREMKRALALAKTQKLAQRDETLTSALEAVRTKANVLDDLLTGSHETQGNERPRCVRRDDAPLREHAHADDRRRDRRCAGRRAAGLPHQPQRHAAPLQGRGCGQPPCRG
ncbi:MCP four helix bundle domain-containing protein [Rhizobacter sp. J219]|uniref:MCP four helix bundle domain-containing protein n=1 Tax=Rhizobacter sp. J219 TaxID=2898430 RepID=UPI002150F0B9|nr:MCP four helix bundle domain-containing protein [Rhizobacter sp. J219]MCR5885123.1 MCP four helix bundle domain-containing protein [Rhizobacter sp. J219]